MMIIIILLMRAGYYIYKYTLHIPICEYICSLYVYIYMNLSIQSSHHYVVEKFPPHKQHHSFQRPISKGFRNDIMFKGSEKERLATVYCYWHRDVLCKKSGNLSSEVCGIEVSPL